MLRKKKGFISFSHKDEVLLNRLKNKLVPFNILNLIQFWDDSRIEAGDKWEQEIERALESTKIALLLVSNNFFESKFIMNKELPFLLKKEKKRELMIFSVFIDNPDEYLKKEAANKELVNELRKIQAINYPTNPLNGLSDSDKEKILDNVAVVIAKALKPKQEHILQWLTIIFFVAVCIFTFNYLFNDSCSLDRQHNLVVSSNIKIHSEIYLDSKNVGIFENATPITIPNVCEGSHKISMKSGDTKQDKEIFVEKNDNPKLVFFNIVNALSY